MKTNTYQDFINAGYSPARARALSADSNANWKARGGGERKTSKTVPEPETLREACSEAFDQMTNAGVPPAQAGGFLIRGLLALLAEESAKKAPQEKGGEE